MKYITKAKQIFTIGAAALTVGTSSVAYSAGMECQSTRFKNGGRQSICHYDKNNDGKTDLIRTAVYDSQNKMVKESFDLDADGKPDRIFTRSYDSNGELAHIRSWNPRNGWQEMDSKPTKLAKK